MTLSPNRDPHSSGIAAKRQKWGRSAQRLRWVVELRFERAEDISHAQKIKDRFRDP
ncbi:MAG TPA: hypothetical protein VK629_05325 [Steroidobacteraceae bacterium]|nr:hypothetical protein [Steroidobacteraceae bacterium]